MLQIPLRERNGWKFLGRQHGFVSRKKRVTGQATAMLALCGRGPRPPALERLKRVVIEIRRTWSFDMAIRLY